ncbi:toll/interleukin-1 receptor domain-containing protein [Sinorhizobium chiapasense]|uniref:Toll/interleukin-1 receptor domain-containing protein n=1 Tax=Sinorhizobium chiapasense TaxID=501572 RepID=A0ABZ2BFU2_9HYPH
MALTYKGRPFNASTFAKDIETAAVEQMKEQLWQRFASIRHPETGEFPTVLVLGNTIEDLHLKIEGTQSLLDHVKEQMDRDDREATIFMATDQTLKPKAFLSYSFDDGDIARRIANSLMEHGIDVWWAEWEMKAGDSLRQRIDEGLAGCTHFIVLLTPGSQKKPWVNQEMDAGLVKRIAGQARFVALRHELPASQLPALLSGMMSPEITNENFDESIRDLVNDIHGISRKPPLGKAPATTQLPTTSHSKTATAIAEIFVRETKTALFGDPQKETDELAAVIGVSVEDIEDALYELGDMVTVTLNRVLPKTTLYTAFDGFFKDWSPEKDALRLAADLVNDPSMPHNTEEVAARYSWDVRRMNPALAYLMERKLIIDYRTLANDWYSFRVVATDHTRRFVKSRN